MRIKLEARRRKGNRRLKFETDFEMMNAEFLMSNDEVKKIEIQHSVFGVRN
jgi:hypothetical protein